MPSIKQPKSIPHGRRINRIPCWDVECEKLYQTFLRSSEESNSSRAATALLTGLTENGETDGLKLFGPSTSL